MRNREILAFLEERKVPIPLEPIVEELSPIETVACTTYQDLLTFFESQLYLGKNLRDSIAVVAATILSTHLPVRPLWFRMIGPPGSAKSSVVDTFSADRQYCYSLDFFTGFHSGRGKDNADASLLPKLDGKCFIISDADTIDNNPNKAQIIGEMRRIYDGQLKTEYRNTKSGEYAPHMSNILCGTDILRTMDFAPLGERWLDCEIFDPDEDLEDKILDRAFENATELQLQPKGTDPNKQIKSACAGFIRHKLSYKPSRVPRSVRSRIKPLAKLVAFARAKVKRNRKDDPQHDARRELATRLVHQLSTAYYCLWWVWKDTPEITDDEEIHRLVRKIALDTAKGYVWDIIELLIRRPQGMTQQQIAQRLGWGKTTVGRIVSDMHIIGSILYKKVPTGGRGRDSHYFFLPEKLVSLYRQSHEGSYVTQG